MKRNESGFWTFGEVYEAKVFNRLVVVPDYMKRLVGQICSHLITLLLQGQSALWPHKNDEGPVS